MVCPFCGGMETFSQCWDLFVAFLCGGTQATSQRIESQVVFLSGGVVTVSVTLPPDSP